MTELSKEQAEQVIIGGLREALRARAAIMEGDCRDRTLMGFLKGIKEAWVAGCTYHHVGRALTGRAEEVEHPGGSFFDRLDKKDFNISYPICQKRNDFKSLKAAQLHDFSVSLRGLRRSVLRGESSNSIDERVWRVADNLMQLLRIARTEDIRQGAYSQNLTQQWGWVEEEVANWEIVRGEK